MKMKKLVRMYVRLRVFAALNDYYEEVSDELVQWVLEAPVWTWELRFLCIKRKEDIPHRFYNWITTGKFTRD